MPKLSKSQRVRHCPSCPWFNGGPRAINPAPHRLQLQAQCICPPAPHPSTSLTPSLHRRKRPPPLPGNLSGDFSISVAFASPSANERVKRLQETQRKHRRLLQQEVGQVNTPCRCACTSPGSTRAGQGEQRPSR